MSDRTLLLGIDLGNEKTQLAVYDRKTHEPLLIGSTEENPDGLLETVIVREGQEPLRNFVDKIQQGEDIVVNGKYSHPVNVLAYYFRKTLSLTRKQYPGETIRQLVVTVPEAAKEFVQMIYDALDKIGIGKERAIVLSHKQSFMYYVLYQKKEIWVNDVGVFDYSENRLNYYQMQVDKAKEPVLAGVHGKDYSDALALNDMGGPHKAAIFENIVYGAIHKQLLSTLYMTGDGFEGDWAESVFRKLCIGRRLFKGRNLYVSGACYAAYEMVEHKRLEHYLLLDEEMITSHVLIRAYTDAEEKEILLARAGTPWYLVDEEIDVIPDGDTEIPVTVRNVFDQKEKQFMLDLEPVLTRADKHCRLGLRVRFASTKMCVVTLKDKGFGDMYPTSNRIWEKSFEIS